MKNILIGAGIEAWAIFSAYLGGFRFIDGLLLGAFTVAIVVLVWFRIKHNL